ncbi:hypothetical protein A3A70_02800 [candidate division WWE3 bacterium RIFCSPLOWO2_01_FULL_42_11]|uniref:Yip1 domain-containing protein n=1 Tax=candidate division WWE3 bacterium RIFCSPLOWO2_01_FULL_42_11 TaxID=1802627 RepID=A0A1F4VL94_UNCKA|nr:MAG: hypothetical protein A3A70_02800 [candidate division WWE3 bacterium RIFCSPLOWO2_01_FULL_42_11]
MNFREIIIQLVETNRLPLLSLLPGRTLFLGFVIIYLLFMILLSRQTMFLSTIVNTPSTILVKLLVYLGLGVSSFFLIFALTKILEIYYGI